MNAVLIENDYPITADVIAGILAIPLPQTDSEDFLEIFVPRFQIRLNFPLEHIELIALDSESGKVIVTSAAGEDVALIFSLSGKFTNGGSQFQPEETALNIEVKMESPKAEFTASTLWLLFGLGEQVSVKMMGVDLNLNFALPLAEAGRLVQRRRAACQLMIIEQAADVRFFFTEDVSADDLNAIATTYRAIIDRYYLSSEAMISGVIKADQSGLEWLAEHTQPSHFRIGPVKEEIKLLGQTITLGNTVAVVEDGIILDSDKVHREVACGDGHPVEIKILSLKGQVRYEFPEAPSLPSFSWEPGIQRLIDLEKKLDDQLVERYHALAASTLANLTDEEKAEITARPELDEEAFDF